MKTDPKSAERPEIEATIVAWRAKRQERLDLEKEVALLEKEEKEMKSWLIEVFREQKFEGIIIGGRSTGLSTNQVHSVKNKEEFVQFIYDNEAIELLQFRLSESAINDRDDVPGLELVDTYNLYDRKA